MTTGTWVPLNLSTVTMCPRQWFLNPAFKREHELVTHFLIHSHGKPREVPALRKPHTGCAGKGAIW